VNARQAITAFIVASYDLSRPKVLHFAFFGVGGHDPTSPVVTGKRFCLHGNKKENSDYSCPREQRFPGKRKEYTG
jgi:hypothetical protein